MTCRQIRKNVLFSKYRRNECNGIFEFKFKFKSQFKTVTVILLKTPGMNDSLNQTVTLYMHQLISFKCRDQ